MAPCPGFWLRCWGQHTHLSLGPWYVNWEMFKYHSGGIASSPEPKGAAVRLCELAGWCWLVSHHSQSWLLAPGQLSVNHIQVSTWSDCPTVKCLFIDLQDNGTVKYKPFLITLLSHWNSPSWLLPFLRLLPTHYFLNFVSCCYIISVNCDFMRLMCFSVGTIYTLFSTTNSFQTIQTNFLFVLWL